MTVLKSSRLIAAAAPVLLLITVLGLQGCNQSVKVEKTAVAKMSLAQARQIIQRADRFYYADGSSAHEQRALEFGPDHMIEYRYTALSTRSTKRVLCPYASLSGGGYKLPQVVAGSQWIVNGCDNNGFQSPQDCNRIGVCMSIAPPDQQSTGRAAEAVERWKTSTPEERQHYAAAEREKFQAIADLYRKTRPAPTEEVRRFEVIAENAVRDKRYNDAISAYEDGLRIAPWWPQGHFNMALLLGQVHYYDEAVEHMQDYLALVPDAPNARQVRDQMYKWQDEENAATPAQ